MSIWNVTGNLPEGRSPLKRKSSHAVENCRAAVRFRCVETSVCLSHHIFSYVLLKRVLHAQTVRGMSLHCTALHCTSADASRRAVTSFSPVDSRVNSKVARAAATTALPRHLVALHIARGII